ncbi:MAG: hypothetical protein AAF827_02330 [Cyanobacteria bacterium P01_D01_bin.6]
MMTALAAPVDGDDRALELYFTAREAALADAPIAIASCHQVRIAQMSETPMS